MSKDHHFAYSLSFPGSTVVNATSDEALATATPLHQCAESKIYCCDYYGAPAVCKHRFAKAYRHRTLDTKLREQRTVREARALVRCHKAGIRVPTVYGVEKRSCKIFMEKIAGATVKEALDNAHEKIKQSLAGSDCAMGEKAAIPTPEVGKLLRGVGEIVGLMHNIDVIHGDLTTSNFMAMAPTASPGSKEQLDRDGIVVLDLGLVSDKNSPEERAVDLYVLERAIISTHPFLEKFAARVILQGYEKTVEAKKGKLTLARLELVRARGRKRSMVG